MKWGHRFEGAIAEALQERIGCNYIGSQVCFQSDDRPWQLATLDRLIDGERIAEFKSVGYEKARELGEDGDVDSLPIEWQIQGQHQLAVTKRKVVIFAVFVGMMEDIRVYPVERNNELIDQINDVEAEFWNSVESKTPPLSLGIRDSEALVKHFGVQEGQIALGDDIQAVVDQYNEIKESIGFLEAQKDERKASIIDALCGVSSGVLPDGRIIKCSVSDIAESVSVRKAHRRINLSFRTPRRS